MTDHWSSRERKGRGRRGAGKGRGGCCLEGRGLEGAIGELRQRGSVPCCWSNCALLLGVCCVAARGRRKEKREKRKGREKWEILKISGEKNKRQFIKLV
jgi:hypothetical protein